MAVTKLSKIERALIFASSFLICLFFLYKLRLWSYATTRYFFFTNRWLELVFVMLISTAFGMFVTWYLQFEYDVLAGLRYKKRRKTH